MLLLPNEELSVESAIGILSENRPLAKKILAMAKEVVEEQIKTNFLLHLYALDEYGVRGKEIETLWNQCEETEDYFRVVVFLCRLHAISHDEIRALIDGSKPFSWEELSTRMAKAMESQP